MDIRMHPVGIYQALIPRHMRQNPKLELGVIRIHEKTPFLWHKDLSDLAPQLHSHRNVLKVWICRTEPPRSRDGLVEGRMDPIIPADIGCKAVCIGRFQLCKAAIFQHVRYNGMFLRQFFQHIRCCRVTGLCLFSSGQAHFFKQDLSKLFGGIDIKLCSRLLINAFL